MMCSAWYNSTYIAQTKQELDFHEHDFHQVPEHKNIKMIKIFIRYSKATQWLEHFYGSTTVQLTLDHTQQAEEL